MHDKAEIIKTDPVMDAITLLSEVKTAAKGSGDNAIIYLPPYSDFGYVRGTIPMGDTNFIIRGAIPDPAGQLARTFSKKNISNHVIHYAGSYNGISNKSKEQPFLPVIFYTHFSPTLDSINYWFMHKSINLYGEAFVKAIGYKKEEKGNTETGIKWIKDFWKPLGIESSAIKILDGSGLSPANRVTTKALVQILTYAKNKEWFGTFYNSLPVMNGIKMKSGYIGGVRSYSGYIKSNAGIEYTFAFIINNFDGSPTTVREKMYKVLDLLK
jgi:D-alanyl-D-alanine carboxypeptidase/D-alanyl-D-alanine-endopeptidase (penicillin-binding protein 4)